MKKTILFMAIAISIVSCKPSTDSKEIKTAYVDTSKLLEQYTEAKDIEDKYKSKSEIMGKELEGEIAQFKLEASNFQKKAQENGSVWAQENGAKLQKREQQLTNAQQTMSQQLQQESGVEMDTLVKKVKKFIKDYGKEKGYAYIYGTGEAATVLYAEEKYDITKEIIKLLNENYSKVAKTALKVTSRKD